MTHQSPTQVYENVAVASMTSGNAVKASVLQDVVLLRYLGVGGAQHIRDDLSSSYTWRVFGPLTLQR